MHISSTYPGQYVEGVFRHFVINLSEKIIITVKSKGTGGLIIVFKRIGDVKETF